MVWLKLVTEPVFEVVRMPELVSVLLAVKVAVEVALPIRFIVPLLTKPLGRFRLPPVAVG